MTDEKHVYFPGLDGIRAIAAMAVLFSHTLLALPEFGIEVRGTKGFLLAGFGVSIFFCLSGFLITFLLLKNGVANFSISNFYMRRVLRIWPLYYLYLVVFMVTEYATSSNGISNSIFYYLFLTANIPLITGTAIPYIGHYWSIGVEEQFYIFWPIIMKKAKERLTLYIVIGILLFISTKLILKFTLINYDQSLIYKIVHISRFHCMLIGGLGAVLFFNRNEKFIKICTSRLMQFGAWIIMGFVSTNNFHVASILDNEIICIVTLIIIVSQIENGKTMINLNNVMFNLVGKISYGIYVIHPLIILGSAKVIKPLNLNFHLKIVFAFASVTVFTLIIAWISYHYFELYFLNLRARFSDKKQ